MARNDLLEGFQVGINLGDSINRAMIQRDLMKQQARDQQLREALALAHNPGLQQAAGTNAVDLATGEDVGPRTSGKMYFDQGLADQMEARKRRAEMSEWAAKQDFLEKRQDTREARKYGWMGDQQRQEHQNRLQQIKLQMDLAESRGDRESADKLKNELTLLNAKNAAGNALVDLEYETPGGLKMKTKVPASMLPQSSLPPELGGSGSVSPKKGPGKLTDSQMNMQIYGKRMQDVENIFGDLEKKGFEPTSYVSGKALNSGWTPNLLVPENWQRFDQAKRNFVNAVLRRESGAVISESEFDNANKQYFPQPGDTLAVVAQKKQNRERVIGEFMRLGNVPAQGIPGTEGEVSASPIQQRQETVGRFKVTVH